MCVCVSVCLCVHVANTCVGISPQKLESVTSLFIRVICVLYTCDATLSYADIRRRVQVMCEKKMQETKERGRKRTKEVKIKKRGCVYISIYVYTTSTRLCV